MYTTDDALEDLRAIVAEVGPEYIYASDPYATPAPLCVYVQNDAPSCIVGHVLARRGVPLEAMLQFDPAPENGLSGESASVSVPALIEDVSQEAVALLDLVQDIQDGGHSWGVALAAAEAYVQPHPDDFEWDTETRTWTSVEDSFRVL